MLYSLISQRGNCWGLRQENPIKFRVLYEWAGYCMNGQFELGAVTPQRYFFGIAVVLGLLFATIGELDEGSSWWSHYLVWQLQTLIPMALFVGCHLLLGQFSFAANLNPWLQLLISGGVGAVVFTPINLGLDVLLQGEVLVDQQILSALLSEITSMAPTAMISWVAINAPWVLGFRFEAAPNAVSIESSSGKAEDSEQSVGISQPHFMTLIHESKRGELLYLKADLHYLSVYSSRGHALVLYNLRDAMEELPRELGFQCHRSYWVCQEQVVTLEKSGRQGVLKLKDGSKVPVSRSFLASVTALLASRGMSS